MNPNYIGNPQKEYVISIVDHRRIPARSNWIGCLWALNLSRLMGDALNVTIAVDPKRIAAHIPEHTIEVANKSGVRIQNKNHSLSSFFMVNDHVFMVVNTDCPQAYADEWIPYYSERCSAFFVLQYRFSTIPLFEAAPIPVHPLPWGFPVGIPSWYLEQQWLMNKPRDISVFFSGRVGIRARRGYDLGMLQRRFPDAVTNDSNHRRFSPQEYCDYMSRTKIAWSPRSVFCSSSLAEENGITGHEGEGMAAQAMVIRHALHVKESEPRIPGIHFVEVSPFATDLMEKVDYYLSHDKEREEIAYNGRKWYERNWAPTAQAHYLINRCLEAMNEPFEPWPH